MENYIIQLIMAPIGSIGFALLFRLRLRYLPTAAVGGFFCWGIYLLAAHFTEGVFLPTMISSAYCALFSEIAARIHKAPATLFLITSLVPLIPGSTLYYTMLHAAQRNWPMAAYFGVRTGQFALGIAAGSCIVWVCHDILRSFSRSNPVQTHSEE